MAAVIVAVGGASCSGKSSLCRMLLKLLGPHTLLLPQDDYFKTTFEVDKATGLVTWDTPAALDWDRIKQRMKEMVENPSKFCQSHGCDNSVRHVIITEGFLAFWDAELRAMYNLSYFMDIDLDLSERRRQNRPWEGDDEAEVPSYWREVGWPAYLRYNPPEHHQAAIILKATDDFSKMSQTIANEILKAVNN